MQLLQRKLIWDPNERNASHFEITQFNSVEDGVEEKKKGKSSK
ncbi:hypothetical protein AB205_0198870 [Aquarana catesbeiana]|uniref:Uncharacterized protein n=1 Tax=Aquarana catesbeiana TaxID=8400 RepID=A0A2G9QM36_AQUCT|nr:hypothetical protein AB205_0198870 [Aquarana catesbeiana]